MSPMKRTLHALNDLHVASDDGTDINFIYGLRIQKDLISRYKMILEGSDDK